MDKNPFKPLTITKRVEWTMGHRIPEHPLDNNLHGHRLTLEVEMESKMGKKRSMVEDITILKKMLEKQIVAPLDHSFVLWKKDETMQEFFQKNKKLKHLVLDGAPTMENLLLWILDQLKRSSLETKTIRIKRMRLWESPSSSATIEM